MRLNLSLLAFISAALLVSPSFAADKSARAVATESALPKPELVWPLPPDPPRIRWVQQFQSLDEVTEKKKQSWMEKVAGAKSADERIQLNRPYGIAVDSKGRIYVADGVTRTVYIVDQAQRKVDARRGSPATPLALPIGVALDEKDRLFVSDSFLHALLCFEPDGRMAGYFGTDKLGRPAGIALDRVRHRLYVADAKEHRIAVFDSSNFAFQKFIGGPSSPGGREDGLFATPSNVAVDRAGKLYVTDTFNHRVQIFDAQGKFVRAFGSHGIRPGQFVRPKGIAVDSEGHIYVADSEFNNFQIFTPEGKALLAVGSLGRDPGKFFLLAGLAVDNEDRILTTEQEGGRIQVFKYIPQPGSAGGKEVQQAKH